VELANSNNQIREAIIMANWMWVLTKRFQLWRNGRKHTERSSSIEGSAILARWCSSPTRSAAPEDCDDPSTITAHYIQDILFQVNQIRR
jgi:hypothetical protein